MGTSYPCASVLLRRRSGQRIHSPDKGAVMAIAAVFEFPGEPVEKYRKVFDAGEAIVNQPNRLYHVCYRRLHRHRCLGRRTVLRRLRRDPRPGPAPRRPRPQARRLPRRAGHDARRHPSQLAGRSRITGGAAACHCLLHRRSAAPRGAQGHRHRRGPAVAQRGPRPFFAGGARRGPLPVCRFVGFCGLVDALPWVRVGL